MPSAPALAGLRAATTRLARRRGNRVFRLIPTPTQPVPTPSRGPRRCPPCGPLRGAVGPAFVTPHGDGPAAGRLRPRARRGRCGRAWSVPRGARTAPTRPPRPGNRGGTRTEPVRARLSAARWRALKNLLRTASWLHALRPLRDRTLMPRARDIGNPRLRESVSQTRTGAYMVGMGGLQRAPFMWMNWWRMISNQSPAPLRVVIGRMRIISIPLLPSQMHLANFRSAVPMTLMANGA